jgi:hypothetical protein
MKKLLIAFFVLLLSLITPLASTPLAAATSNTVEAESTIAAIMSGESTMAAAKRRYRRGRYRGPVRASRAPIGASARCRDGTYSFSRNRRGTCSWHGGVAAWLY